MASIPLQGVLAIFIYMAKMDSFELNIEGVRQLVDSGLNKENFNPDQTEGIVGSYIDEFELELSDEDLLQMRKNWEESNASYDAGIATRATKNKTYLFGLQNADQKQDKTPIASNILFEAQETFIPQALAKNPEPVVYSDNTPEGKIESNDLKTMLQYHANELELKRKLSVMIRHWSVYFIGIIKHGWDKKTNDITSVIRKPKNFILDRNGYIDEFGRFVGSYLGEKMESTAGELIDLYPKMSEYITIKVDGKLGTPVIRTEWWTDEYTFTTFEDKVLEKHKNPYFNYGKKQKDEIGETVDIKGENHFSHPLMPYTFLSIFSMQEQPHDFTTLIEQNLKNQDRISERDTQIDKNLRTNNNGIIVSGISFDQETAAQAAQALQDGDPILAPDGNVDGALKRIPANNLPNGIIDSQEIAKNALRGIFGVQGLTAQEPTNNTTAHGMVLNQEYDATRISGGIGDAIEVVARNIFNWWTQLYYVFYDEEHYASVLGTGRAVEYIKLKLYNSTRKFVVTVSPNSMAPRDELSERNNAIALWNARALDPITLFQKLDDPDPMNTARKVVLWTTNPQMYAMQYFPEEMMNLSGANPEMNNISNMQTQEEPDITADLGEVNNPLANNMLGQQAPLP